MLIIGIHYTQDSRNLDNTTLKFFSEYDFAEDRETNPFDDLKLALEREGFTLIPIEDRSPIHPTLRYEKGGRMTPKYETWVFWELKDLEEPVNELTEGTSREHQES